MCWRTPLIHAVSWRTRWWPATRTTQEINYVSSNITILHRLCTTFTFYFFIFIPSCVGSRSLCALFRLLMKPPPPPPPHREEGRGQLCAWLWDRREAAETSGVRGELSHIIKASSQLCACSAVPRFVSVGVKDDVSICWMSAGVIKRCVCSIKHIWEHTFQAEHVITTTKKRCFRNKK